MAEHIRTGQSHGCTVRKGPARILMIVLLGTLGVSGCTRPFFRKQADEEKVGRIENPSYEQKVGRIENPSYEVKGSNVPDDKVGRIGNPSDEQKVGRIGNPSDEEKGVVVPTVVVIPAQGVADQPKQPV